MSFHLAFDFAYIVLFPVMIMFSATTLIPIQLALAQVCPPQCSCVPNRMNCETPGLKQFPQPYMPELESLLIHNQTFASTQLGPQDLHMYRNPEYGGQIRLKSLHIRFCNIMSLKPNTFQAIGNRLEILDLTGNPLRELGEFAFNGLDGLTLILDEIRVTRFLDHTFAGVKSMKSLIMRQSSLKELPFESLKQLTSEGRLNQLLLRGNKLKYLDEKYDQIFEHLQDFEINDNLWHCDCRLNWLIRRHRIMSGYRDSGQTHRSRREWTPSLMSSSWQQEDNQPKCVSPPILAGVRFGDLITDMAEAYTPLSVGQQHFGRPPFVLYCPPPKLERLDVDLSQIYQPTPKTNGKQDSPNDGGQVSKNRLDQSKIRLTCAVKGSPRLAISWHYHHPGLGQSNVSSRHITQKFTDHKQIPKMDSSLNEPWSMRYEEVIRAESELDITRQEESDIYSCIGQDVIGNVSAMVRIQWPSLVSPTSEQKSAESAENAIIRSSSSSAQLDNKTDYLRRWSSQSAPDPGAHVTPYPESLLHAKRFSLGELLAAIAGTFLSTVLLFFIIHQSIHRHFSTCEKHKRARSTTSDGAILTSPKISPGGTSSSNTSYSVPTSGIKTHSTDNGQAHPPLPNNSANMTNFDALSLTTNLLGTHPYHHFDNGNPNMNQCTLPIGNMRQPNSQAEFNRLLGSLPNASMGPDGRLNSFISYEPVTYSDVNNVTYDLPCSNPMNSCANEQRIPLLYNGNLADLYQPVDHRNPNRLQGGLMIPPPPSIPQPSLPAHSSAAAAAAATQAAVAAAAAMTLNNVRQKPNANTNLLTLQAGYSTQDPATLSSISNSQISQGSSATTANYLNYHT